MGYWFAENAVKLMCWAVFLPALPFIMLKITEFVFENDNGPEGPDGMFR